MVYQIVRPPSYPGTSEIRSLALNATTPSTASLMLVGFRPYHSNKDDKIQTRHSKNSRPSPEAMCFNHNACNPNQKA